MGVDVRLEQNGEAAEDDGGAQNDAILARRIAEHDTSAWDVFFDRYSEWAYRFAYFHLNKNHADAEDLCSEILLAATRSIRSFDTRMGTLDEWIHGLAKHRLIRFYKRRHIEISIAPSNVDIWADRNTAAQRDPSEEACLRNQVNLALAGLTEKQSRVLIGKYVEGYTMEELARCSDTTPKAIESLLSRARAAFRTAFIKLQDSTRE